MWILQLNPMQGNYERLEAVARAETREALEAMLAREAVEPYTEDDHNAWGPCKLRKAYRKAGPLEYMNPPDREECFVRVSLDDWIANTVREYERRVNHLPMV